MDIASIGGLILALVGILGGMMIEGGTPTEVVKVFLHKGHDGEAVLQQLVGFANKARKSGIVSLDADVNTVEDPFLKQALMLAVDGTEPSELRKIMEFELGNKSEIEEKIPAVFEAAGGHSPTWGVIG